MRSLLLLLTLTIIFAAAAFGQAPEPEFIGEAYSLKADGSLINLDKKLGGFTSGISWTQNSWNALNLEVDGGKAQTRFTAGEPLQFVVRAVDHNSDPVAIISIYKLKTKGKKRMVMLSKDNSGTFMRSRTNQKDLLRFDGKKYGLSSYLITLKDLEKGEYGIVVANPNTSDQKRTVVSCFGID